MISDQFQAVKEETLADVRKREKPKFATVTGVSVEGLQLNLPVNGVDSGKSTYKRLASYSSPQVGDRVYVEWIGNPNNQNDGTYFVIGKVT